MVAYVGDTVAVRVEATDPFTKEPLTPDDGYSCVVDVYQVGVNPKTTPAVRDDDSQKLAQDLPTIYDATQQAYFAFVSTTTFQLTSVTNLWYRGKLVGPEYSNVEFARFKLSP